MVMTNNSHKTTIRYLGAILKHQVEIWLEKDKTSAIFGILLKGEIQKRIDYWLLQEKKLLNN